MSDSKRYVRGLLAADFLVFTALYEAKGAGRNCVRVAREKASAVLSVPPTSGHLSAPRLSLPARRRRSEYPKQ